MGEKVGPEAELCLRGMARVERGGGPGEKGCSGASYTFLAVDHQKIRDAVRPPTT